MHPAADLLLMAVMTLPLADLVLMAVVHVALAGRGGRRSRQAQGGEGERGGSKQLWESHVRHVLLEVTTGSGHVHRPIAMLSRCCDLFRRRWPHGFPGHETAKKKARRKGRAVIREETPRKGRSAKGGSTG